MGKGKSAGKRTSGPAHFHCRIITVPKLEEAVLPVTVRAGERSAWNLKKCYQKNKNINSPGSRISVKPQKVQTVGL